MHEKTKTTTLIEIRDFLAAEGCALPPWGAPERAVDALYRLLRERRDDDRFWRELAGLASRLEDARFDAAPLAEVLGDATVDRLIGDLRRSLDGPSAGAGAGVKASARAWVAGAAGASALAAFLLLGAAGCREGGDGDGDADADVEPDADVEADADTDAGADADSTCDEAIGLGYTGETASVYCDLLGLVEGADLTASTREQLLSCLPGLDAAYRANLLEQFATMSATELSDYLQGMTGNGEICGEDAH